MPALYGASPLGGENRASGMRRLRQGNGGIVDVRDGDDKPVPDGSKKAKRHHKLSQNASSPINMMHVVPRRLLWVFVLPALLLAACGGTEGSSTPTPTATVAASPVAADVPPADIQVLTSLETVYYEVFGLTTDEIFDDIELYGPQDDQGQQGSGLASIVWSYKWTGDHYPDGSCAIQSLTIRADLVMEIPRHAHEELLAPGILANWLEYAAGVEVHEQRHVDIYLLGTEAMAEEMRRIGVKPDCDALQDRIESVWDGERARIDGLQDAFHAEEDVRLLARRAPLESQIDSNRAQLQSLLAEVTRLDGELAALRGNIQEMDRQMGTIEAELTQIRQQYPGDLPEPVRLRFNELVETNNALLSNYNAQVDVHNSSLSRRNTVVDDYEALLVITNQLVDEYNWAR